MDNITYAALRLACNRINAIKKVDAIISSCSSFKIGKTGDSLYNRLSNYDGEFDHVDPIFVGSKSDVDDMESYLIDQYINHPKCDNKKDGEASNNDPMAEDAEKYQVYVVWK